MALRRILLAPCLVLGALVASMGSVQAADESPTALFLIDGSGSMWGQLDSDRRAKLDAIRDSLSQILPQLRPDVRLGLASFGHRRRGSCSDAEVIIAPAPGNTQQVLVPLEKLNAAGKGPLVLGLREAAAAIGTAAPATIVLIHDDVDNCGQDLCAAAAEIAKANPRLTVHTISLALDKPRLQQMGCLARATNGKLYNAKDAAGLASALDQIVKLAHLDAGAPPDAEKSASDEPGEGKPAAQAPPGLYLSAGLGPDSATLESPVRWRVTKGGTDEIVREAKAPTLAEKLPPGSYDVEARLGLAAARHSVEVKADAPTTVRLNLNAGVLKMMARAAKDGQLLQTPLFTVTALNEEGKSNTGAPLWIGREAKPEIVLPAGEYKVNAENGLAHQELTVKIAAATGTTFDAMLATGRLELSAARSTDATEPLTEGATFIVYEDDPDSPGGRREVMRSAAPSPVFALPAGTYYVTARTAGAEARDQIAIGAGDAVRRVLPLALSRLQLSATLDGKPAPEDLPLLYTVYRLDGEAREVVRTAAKEPALELSAGRYRLEAAVSATNVKTSAEIMLVPGQSQKVALKLEAAHVTLKLANERAGAGDVYWEIKDAQQRTVLRTSQPEPVALLGPGRYIVMTETRDQQLMSTFELKAGETRTIDISG